MGTAGAGGSGVGGTVRGGAGGGGLVFEVEVGGGGGEAVGL